MTVFKLIHNTIYHLKTIITHKIYVMKYCFIAGLYWQGIIHDISKFSWTELSESILYYDGKISPVIRCKSDKGYSLGWLHHKGHNKHHYEYWTDDYDLGTRSIRVPFKYSLEMICDYLGAGKAYCGKNFTIKDEYNWWITKRDHYKLHPDNVAFIDAMFSEMLKTDSLDCLKKENAKRIWDSINGDIVY